MNDPLHRAALALACWQLHPWGCADHWSSLPDITTVIRDVLIEEWTYLDSVTNMPTMRVEELGHDATQESAVIRPGANPDWGWLGSMGWARQLAEEGF